MELEKLMKRLKERRMVAKQYQKKYNFEIPEYVLVEMNNINNNLFALIWLACKCGRISDENAKLLINDLKKNNK